MSASLFLRTCLCILTFCFASSLAHSEEDMSNPEVALVIRGNIETMNDCPDKGYSISQLEGLGIHEIMTETPWTTGIVNFSGVLFRDILNDAGASGEVVVASALNDYSVEIPTSDLEDYDVILAIKKDGEYLTIRDKGPLWVIYPWTEQRMLQNELYYSRAIWQLRRIEIR